eukprot:TRINITY_DN10188_c1_g1_i7.p3 TRINITY_DN10188_c1_g1~~TRINITY_DN10188_c1_g1_i7.p3  ORF type:complete len:239 (+),score=32.78 TRINITY_DN10188_c1_g1_i7:166-882(+)
MVTVVEISDYEVPHQLSVCTQLMLGEEGGVLRLSCSDGKDVTVPVCLLRKYSQVFDEILGAVQCEGGIPVSEESHVWLAFVELLSMHISGEYDLETKNIINTVVMADKYNFPAVLRICDEFLSASPSIEYSTDESAYDWVFSWIVFAERYSLQRTRDRCLKFIKLNTQFIDFEQEEVTKCLKDLGMDVMLVLFRYVVARLNEVDRECTEVKSAVQKEGMELHYIPILQQHVIHRTRIE